MGGVLGVVDLWDGFSVVELGSAVIAGAIFYAVIGVFGVRFARTRIYSMVLCAAAGGLAGAAWAGFRSLSIPAAVVVGTLLGAAVGFLEYSREPSSRDAA